MIEINNTSIRTAINRIQSEYSHISGDLLKKATSRALNRAASSGRTESSKQIRQKYTIGAAKINNEIKTNNSNYRNLEASIRAKGSPLSLSNFGAKQEQARGTTSFNRSGRASSRLNRRARTNAVRGVSFKVLKSGKEKNLPTAFIQVANGGITVFARGRNLGGGQGFEFAKPRLPIGKITTLSVPMMFANDAVMPSIQSKTVDVLNDRITHEINYLLRR